jgi:hypothetical protein
MHARFGMPHQMNLNRPPPPLNMNPMDDQRQSWIHNNQVSSDLSNDMEHSEPQSLMSIGQPPQQFMPQNNRNFNARIQGNFRGQNRGGLKMRGGMNNSNSNNGNGVPFNNPNNFKGNRGGIQSRGRGNFRGNFRGGNNGNNNIINNNSNNSNTSNPW